MELCNTKTTIAPCHSILHDFSTSICNTRPGVGNAFGSGPISEGRVQWRAVPSNGDWSKSWFKLVSAPALTFTVMCWRIFQIWRFSWMLPRATENAVADHMWPEDRYLPTLCWKISLQAN